MTMAGGHGARDAAGGAMRGRTCVVTGATSGIGLETAQALAARGADVVMVARDALRAEEHAQRIRQVTGNPRVNFLLADFASLEQVRELAGQIQTMYPALHVLVNNAGALHMRRDETVDGYERTFAVNHLAPFLLTNLLLPRLKASIPARVITVASAAHNDAHMDFDDLMFAHRRYRGLEAYGQSKLANILFTYELARRLAGSGITANALHPGFVASGFARNNGTLYSLGMSALRPFAISPERGARTSIYLATSPDVADVTGKYFADRRPISSSAESYDTNAQKRLWEISKRLAHVTLGA